MGLIDFLFPKKCVNCGKFGGYVCKSCQVGLWEEEQICPICTRNSRYGLPHKYCHKAYGLDGLTCFWAYDGVAKKIIKKVKYRYFYDVLRELIVNSSEFRDRPEFSYLAKFLEMKPIIVPVPLNEKRYRERGFNQADVIGRAFAARHKLAFDSHLLLRTRDTGHQAGRTRAERLLALENSMKIVNCKLKIPQAILLVDDVWTTGATMSECCRVLKIAGVKRVWGLVLAR